MAYSSSPKADDGQRRESESCQSIEGFGKLGMIVKTALRNRARDQPSAPWWSAAVTRRECTRQECRSCT